MNCEAAYGRLNLFVGEAIIIGQASFNVLESNTTDTLYIQTHPCFFLRSRRMNSSVSPESGEIIHFLFNLLFNCLINAYTSLFWSHFRLGVFKY